MSHLIKDRLLVVGSGNSESGINELLQFIQTNYSTLRAYDEVKGVIEALTIETKYYTASIDLLIDLLEEDQTIEDWTNELLDDELQDLRGALNGLILCIDKKDDLEVYTKVFQRVLGKLSEESGEELGIYSWGGMYCVVLFGDFTPDEIEQVEDLLIGVEVIHFHTKAEFNKFKERLGKSRLKEMIEVHNWKNLDEKTTKTQEIDNLDDIMTQLKEAKLEMTKLPKDEQHSFAQMMAEKLTKDLF